VTAIGVYVAQIRAKEEFLATKLGAYLPGMAVELRIVLTLSNVAWAAVAKLLVDKGVFTDAELVAALNAAGVAAWQAENPNPLGGVPDAPLP
jgi:hypothetical protein